MALPVVPLAEKSLHKGLAERTVSLGLTIREYADSDWDAICRVHDRARPFELPGSPGSADHSKVRPLAKIAEEEGFFKSRTFVVLTGARVIGFASIEGTCLRFFYVDPDFHRRGVGRALFEYITPMMGTEGHAYVVATNTPAIALYLSAGMEVACRFPGETDGIVCECLRLAFPTSSHRRRPGRPTASALRLEAKRLGVPIEAVQREWPAEP
jgi:GNAT superfamily N-acetyltransferase